MKTFSNMSTTDLCITDVAYAFLLDNILQGRPLIFRFTQAPNEDGTPAVFELENIESAVSLINRLKELISAVHAEMD